MELIMIIFFFMLGVIVGISFAEDSKEDPKKPWQDKDE